MKKISLLLCLSLALCFSGMAQKSTTNRVTKNPAQKSSVSKSINHDSRDISPNRVYNSGHNAKHNKPGQIMAMWDVLFNYPVGGVQEAGVETDGNFIYTSDWASAMFYKYSMTGTLLDSFSIPSVTGIRDLAYDGTYFYGGENAATIYQMDFTNHTLVGTITCPSGTTVRNIAWDPGLGGFWVGGWATDIICVNPSGTVLSTITSASLGLSNMYGSAYDSWTPGGPYLWVFDQGSSGSGAIFNQISLTTLAPTGVTHDCSTDISSSAMAGGAFCYRSHTGEVMLGGVAQGNSIFAYELVHSAAHCDVGPTKLMAPLSSDSLTTSDTVKVQVSNFDTLPHFHIPVNYVIDGGTIYNDTINDTIAGGSFINFAFHKPYNFSLPGHTYNVKIYTAFGCDTVHTNDTLLTTVLNNYDASSVSIDMSPLMTPGSMNPLATVKNTGSVSIYFNVTMNINSYTSTKTVAALAPGASQQVTFDPWNATVGNYSVKVYTQLANDMDHSNDTITAAISVQNPIKAFCYVADSVTTPPMGPAYLYLQKPDSIYSIASQGSQNFIEGGTWGPGNKWYATVATDKTLITIDTVTGARTVIGNMGVDLNGLTYDHTSNKFFGVSWNGTSSSLYSVSQLTGAATLIGNSSTDLLINIASDTLGKLYSIGTTNDMLYSVDKSTGLATSIGSIGFDANYAEGMSFDFNSNTLYLAGYDNASSAGDLSFVNVTTGAATVIGTFESGAEITGFAIPYKVRIPSKDASVSALVSPVSACGLTTENVTIAIDNLGSTAISGFPVSYSINGGTPVTETFSGTIPADSSRNYTFTQQANLSAPGAYTIKAYSSLPGDVFPVNDTLIISVQNIVVSNPPYSMGFETTDDYSTWKIEDANNDGFTWNIATTGGNIGPYCAEYSYNSSDVTVAANDWLITKCIDLQASTTYNVSYYYKVESGTYPEGFTVNIGTAQASSAMTTQITSHQNLTTTTYTQGGSNFTVTAAGTYYIGFQCNSAANEWNLYLDDINITVVPLAVSDTASPDSICMGGTSTLTALASGGTGSNYSYSWSPSTGLSSTTGHVVIASPTLTTTYTVTANDGANTATNSVTVFVKNCSPLHVTVSTSPDSICPGSSSTVTALATGGSGTYTYAWSPATALSSTTGHVVTANPTHTTTYTVTASDGISTATNTVIVVVKNCTGIKNYLLNNSVSIYPNPTKGLLNVISSEKINFIKLYNEYGQLVMSMAVQNKSAIFNTSDLAEGVYYLRIETDKGIASKNVIIQK